MSKLYDQFVLINSNIYQKYEYIIEERLSPLDSNLLGIITNTTLTEDDKISKLLSFSEEHKKKGDKREIANHDNNSDTTGDITDNSFEHLAACFAKKRSEPDSSISLKKNSSNSISDTKNESSNTVVDQDKELVGYHSSDLSSLSEEPPVKKSILDTSSLLKKEKLISSAPSKNTKEKNKQTPIRKSDRAKNPVQWLKYQ